MSKPPIRLGDNTTHGGKVITASSTTIFEGIKVALLGDLVSCPIEGHGTNPIVEGSSKWFSDGKPIAVDGCKAACGCKVISSSNSPVG